MSYKTIVVHVDSSRHAEQRIRIAAELALAHGAHLIGVAATGLSRFAFRGTEPGFPTAVLDSLRERAEQDLARFQHAADAVGAPSSETRLVEDDAAGALEWQARYADLIVVSQADRDDPSTRLATGVPEYVMLNGGKPVLVIPFAGAFAALASNVLIAWDESIEASRAISHALPLLERAHKVTVVVFNPAQPDGRYPGADLALFLARHGVNCEVSAQTSPLDVGSCLLSMTADLGADLIVMGGYGHTRFRELLLGGATATVLESMTVPVLMSH